jgi:hypothetical protein
MTTLPNILHALAVAAAVGVVAGDAVAPSATSPRIEVVGTTLRVHLPDGSIREGAALVGATLVVAVGGETLRVRIASVERDARDPRGKVLLYDFRRVTADGVTPLCTADPDGRMLGMPLAGRSDPSGHLSRDDSGGFELVCTSGAQGKCVRFGYGPWRQARDGRPMLDWFNACVRMLRADYCGDGRAFTRDGTLIDLYDRIGIQTVDNALVASFEAAWGPAGAICVARTRVPDIVNLEGLGRMCPRLSGRLGPGSCNENVPDALILNRSR